MRHPFPQVREDTQKLLLTPTSHQQLRPEARVTSCGSRAAARDLARLDVWRGPLQAIAVPKWLTVHCTLSPSPRPYSSTYFDLAVLVIYGPLSWKGGDWEGGSNGNLGRAGPLAGLFGDFRSKLLLLLCHWHEFTAFMRVEIECALVCIYS